MRSLPGRRQKVLEQPVPLWFAKVQQFAMLMAVVLLVACVVAQLVLWAERNGW